MKILKLLSVFFLTFFLIVPSWAMNLRHPSLAERAQLEMRYKKTYLFGDKDCEIIERENLTELVQQLILHKKIVLFDLSDVIDFAREIKQSGMQLSDLEERITRYQKNGELIFVALRKAISRENFHRWKVKRNETVMRNKNLSFIKTIDALDLSEADRNKIINAFAVCVDSYRHEEDRAFLKPKICSPLADYPKPAYRKKVVKVKRSPAKKESPKVLAYRALMKEAKKVVYVKRLNTFEKVMMGKCVAEQSLRFFIPSHHPLKALKKTYALDRKSPEMAFFMNTGVCSNFSGITYNIARELGLEGNVFLTRRHLHVYIEFRRGKSFYHTHPFNSTSSCDIIRFK